MSFDFVKEERRVGVYYFYIADAEFGAGFIKICTYFPYPAKVWLNGHEWAKRQARRTKDRLLGAGQRLRLLRQPEALQAVCDRFGPSDVQGFFDRWTAVIPPPFSADDKSAGYFWELSMRQVEVSRTIVFDDPRRARGFFEALVTDNVGVGRPEEVRAVFVPTKRGVRTSMPSQTRVFSPGSEVKIDFTFKHSRVKQYLKEGRALRIETVINKPKDIGVLARLEHLPELVGKARQVNDRLLMIERAGQGCAIGSALFERIHQPYVREGQRTGAFRFGDQRAMALAGSLCLVIHAVTGFTNKSLRGQVAGLLGRDYRSSQMSYDLRRIRLHRLIERTPRTNTYTVTAEGIRVAVFYTKLQARLLHRFSRRTSPRRQPRSVEPSPQSSTLSATTSPTHDLEPPPETCHKIQRPVDREDLETRSVPFGDVGTLFSGDGIECVWVRKLDEEIGPDWFQADVADLIVVLQGRLNVEFESDSHDDRVVGPGNVLVLPAGVRCRAYRWPRDASEATIL